MWTNKYKVEFKLLSDHGLRYQNIATHLVEFFKRSSSKEWERKIRRLENKGCQAEWFKTWKDLSNCHDSHRKCIEDSRNSIEQGAEGGSPKIEVKRCKLGFSTTKKSVRNTKTSDESSEGDTEEESDSSSNSGTSSSEESDREESSASESETSQSEMEEKEKKASNKRSRNPNTKQEGNLASLVEVMQLSNAGTPAIDALKNSKQDVKEWFKYFDRYARSLGWSAIKVQLLFKSDAERAWKRMHRDDRFDYEKVRKNLCKKLIPEDRKATATQEFYQAHQNRSESVEEYGRRLKKLARYSEKALNEKDLIARFMASVRKEVRMAIATMNPKSFKKAIKIGMLAENCHEGIRNANTEDICSVQKKEKKKTDQEPRIEEIEEKIEYMAPVTMRGESILKGTSSKVGYSNQGRSEIISKSYPKLENKPYAAQVRFQPHESTMDGSGFQRNIDQGQGIPDNRQRTNGSPMVRRAPLVCYYCNTEDHMKKECDMWNQYIMSLVCSRCGQRGHLARRCASNQ